MNETEKFVAELKTELASLKSEAKVNQDITAKIKLDLENQTKLTTKAE